MRIHRKFKALTLCLGLAGSHVAYAQMTSTNCMAMGGGMVHCDSMGIGGGNQNDGGAALGEGIGALIAKGRENSIRKKVGQLLADGNCEGASRFAFEKGRIELGAEIAQTCRPTMPMGSAYSSVNVPVPAPPPAFDVGRVAHFAEALMLIEGGKTVSKVQTVGNQILLIGNFETADARVTDENRSNVHRELCAFGSAIPFLQSGGSIRMTYVGKEGQDRGAIMTTGRECGF